ncbi:hypothetical protein HK103_000769 [Boothiomyces macroporosus]|uniref:Uncharacterized protein n=1 Tax=Boothiomyces macroporosus TaxID=261099 RepID=A0AAD5UC22_9FUNG|nr:hypothetical protein HK103_000769 [Boothiomyces macroporosus]
MRLFACEPQPVSKKERKKVSPITMDPHNAIENLNLICDILVNQESQIISKYQIDNAVYVQTSKTKKLILDNDNRFEYALVMLQALLYLQNNQIEGAPKATRQFENVLSTIQKSNIHRLQNDIQTHAAKLYSDYIYMLPNRKYLLPMDSDEQDLILLQEAIDNDLKSQMILAMKFQSLGNLEASEFWLSSSSKQGYIPSEEEERRALELFNEKYKNKKYEAEIPVLEVPEPVEEEDLEVSNMAVVNASTFDISNMTEVNLDTDITKDSILESDFLSEKQERLAENEHVAINQMETVEQFSSQEVEQTVEIETVIDQPKEYLVTEAPKVSPEMTDEDLFSPDKQVSQGGFINFCYNSLSSVISTGLSLIYAPAKK